MTRTRLTPVRLALILWIAASVLALVMRWPAIAALALPDTDDAMRMAQVRDLLGGQGWWDLVQYRVNPAGGGVLMHWSRIVDAPIALGLMVIEPLAGPALAERIVAALVPLLLGGALMVATARGYRHLPDPRIAWIAPFFLLFCGYAVMQFLPLRIDHHGWQILLAMLVMGQALAPPSWRAGLLGGFFAAMLLAVSIEGLPLAALFAALAALRWALAGRGADRDRLCGYMLALGIGAPLLQVLTRGPLGLEGRWCDSLSAPYLAAFAVAAAATLAAARANPERRSIRFVLLGGAGLFSAAALVMIEPQCAKGPFAALDPIVVQYWYRGILEGQPIWASSPHDAIFILIPSLVGLAGSALAWRAADTGDARQRWATVIAALAGALLLSLLVMRSVSTAHLFALPGCAWIGLRLWARARAIAAPLPRVAVSVLAALSLPLFSSVAVAMPLGWAFAMFRPAVKDMARQNGIGHSCLGARSIAALDRLAPTTILAPIDLGAPLVFATRHSMVATGHHRNKQAMADTIRAFAGDPAGAEALVRRNSAAMIVICRTASDFTLYRRARKDNLAAQLYAGQAPDWLTPIVLSGDTGLAAWRVKSP